MKSSARIMLLFFAVVALYAQTEYQNASWTNNGWMMTDGCFYHRWQENQTNNNGRFQFQSALIENTNCPVKEMNSEVGVVAPNGKFVPLGPASKLPMITSVRKHHHHDQWETAFVAHNPPINVRVMAMPDGSVVVRPR